MASRESKVAPNLAKGRPAEPAMSYDDKVISEFHRALTPERALRDASTRATGDTYMSRDDWYNASCVDRFGTTGTDTTPTNGSAPVRAEVTQKKSAKQTGAATGAPRVRVKGVVQ